VGVAAEAWELVEKDDITCGVKACDRRSRVVRQAQELISIGVRWCWQNDRKTAVAITAARMNTVDDFMVISLVLLGFVKS
jgi:hypothetical protein